MATGQDAIDRQELKDIVLADVVLIVAFSLTLTGGIGTLLSNPSQFTAKFIYIVPIVAVGVTLSFILHELMHKFVAQHYGAVAGFRTSYNGLLITLLTGAFGFLLGIPGATMIYTSRFTTRENGIVSLAGPLTNFAVFLMALGAISLFGLTHGYAYDALSFTIFISLLLAFFNMLPIFPLDGSKVLAWNPALYAVALVVLLGLLTYFTGISLITLVFLIGLALVFSTMYRMVL